jgi:hypothetical protein
MFTKNKIVKEMILCVAFLYSKDNKKIILSLKRPLRHHHIGWKYGRYITQLKDNDFVETQGFLTNTGKFVNRIDGLKIANNAKQIIKKHPCYATLYSEDMWGSSNKSKTQFFPGNLKNHKKRD